MASTKTALDINNLSMRGLYEKAQDINNLSKSGLRENRTGHE
jgi:hypothetical protein